MIKRYKYFFAIILFNAVMLMVNPGTGKGSEAAPASGIEGLYAASIDQKKAFEEYKEKILEEAGEKHGEDMLAVIKEELDSTCTAGMAAFEKFVRYITSREYEVIIFAQEAEIGAKPQIVAPATLDEGSRV